MHILLLGRIIAITAVLAPLLFAPVAYAGYIPMVPIPGVDYDDFDMEAYLRVLYIIAISIAALLATGKLMLAGFQYLGSGANAENKESAKTHLWGAVIGLLIVLLAVTILRTINPDLTGLPALPDPPTIDPFHESVEVVRDPLGGRRTIDEGGSTYVMACDPVGSGGTNFQCDTNVERCECTPGYAGHEVEGNRVTCHLEQNGGEVSPNCGTAGAEAEEGEPGSGSAQVEPPEDLPPDAEAFMVDGELYYVSGVQDADPDTTALYCELGNTACNDYCDAREGEIDMQTGICYMEPQPLQLEVSG